RSRFDLPAGSAGHRVYLRAVTGAPEALLVVDREPAGVFDGNHPVVMITGRGSGRRKYAVAVEAYAGHPIAGTQPDDVGGGDCRRTFEKLELVLQRDAVLDFVFDLRTLLQLAESLEPHSLRRHRLLAELAGVYEALEAMPGEAPESRWAAGLERARRLMRPLLKARNGDTVPQMGLVGHSHIDTAWLWTVAETERKCARTFSSVLNLMEQYPEFTFLQSSPYHADIVRREYPGIFRRIQAMVRAGRWEPNGAMWVEPDCNIPSGEAFVRQLLLGQQFTREHFGYTADTFWQPDVFGYSAALPQILRGCGVEFFLTTKIAWNDTTRFPYDTFQWRGIDGTAVLAHFNKIHCWPDPKTLIEQWQDVQNKDTADRRLSAIGYGDGGGGPQFEMLEFARRVEDLEGCPRASYTSVSGFMQGILDQGRDLPEWIGELYLELHRGTLTSISEVKRLNRLNELALRDAEWACVLASLAGARYPAADLRERWKTLLVNQFHDILPGSSIPEVNDQALSELAENLAALRGLTARALEQVTAAGHRARRAAAAARDSGEVPRAAVVYNSLGWERRGELALGDLPGGVVPADRHLEWQRVRTVDGAPLLLVSGLSVPALGAARLDLRQGRAAGASPFKVRDTAVETPFARVRFDRTGRIVSLIDKASGRQVVAAGGALNALWLGEDVPAGWDNWDVDFDQQFRMRRQDRLTRFEVVADGPLQLRLRCEYDLGDQSKLAQDVVFHSTTARVDFETAVDWAEKHRLLKAGFQVDVLATSARHEIQYGYVERPTHRNRPADRAQFEVCNHRWTDLSENRFGVALLNDGKYGISVDGHDLRLTLLKSGTHPDPRGDAGRHLFTYALLPHAGAFAADTVVRAGYELNVPPLACPAARDAAGHRSLLTVDAPNVVVESVKWAEDGHAFVVRLYEAERSGTRARVRFGVPVKGVAETNLLEEEAQSLRLGRNGAVGLYFRPFEIKTLRVVLPK
ncbi:MAG: glycoside hydrolase family 38 C-terminal domain-containing protein, partial [Gemmatimonadota bacterium]